MSGDTLHPSKGPWNPVVYAPPPQNRLLLVFRYKRKKYVVAECRERSPADLEEHDPEYYHSWITQHNCAYLVEDDDLWMEFPYLTLETEYH